MIGRLRQLLVAHGLRLTEQAEALLRLVWRDYSAERGSSINGSVTAVAMLPFAASGFINRSY
jgi:hypothetical protein